MDQHALGTHTAQQAGTGAGGVHSRWSWRRSSW